MYTVLSLFSAYPLLSAWYPTIYIYRRMRLPTGVYGMCTFCVNIYWPLHKFWFLSAFHFPWADGSSKELTALKILFCQGKTVLWGVHGMYMYLHVCVCMFFVNILLSLGTGECRICLLSHRWDLNLRLLLCCREQLRIFCCVWAPSVVQSAYCIVYCMPLHLTALSIWSPL